MVVDYGISVRKVKERDNIEKERAKNMNQTGAGSSYFWYCCIRCHSTHVGSSM